MKLLDELHHRLGSKSRIRSLFKDVSVQDLEKMLDRLKEVHQEKLQSRVKEDAKRQKKNDRYCRHSERNGRSWHHTF